MIVLKSRQEVETMRRANRIVAQILGELKSMVRAGITTGEIDRAAEELTRRAGARPAFKGYQVDDRKFPRTICISINDEVVHGIPSDSRRLVEGDIVGLDFGVIYDGYYGDAAITVPVGKIDPDSERLVRVTETALWEGIEHARPGRRLGDVSAAIQDRAERNGFSIVREFVGHGIGTRLHEDPQVPNWGSRNRGIRLREGMVLAIEPMVNAGGGEVEILQDGWTAVTRDGRRSAHFEHSVAITDAGPVVLSQL